MSTITKEFAQDIIKGHGYGVAPSAVEALARIALAAMDNETVGYFGRFDPDDEDLIDQCSKNVKGAFPLYLHAQPAKGLELAGWQFKSVNGDWLGLIDEHGKNQAVREGCEVREVFAMADGVNERGQVRHAQQPIPDVNSEPVAYIFKHPAGRLFWALTDESNKGQSDVIPVYAAPQPAPVVPDAYVRDERGRMMLNGVCEPKIGFGAGWNACRAAMLNGGKS